MRCCPCFSSSTAACTTSAATCCCSGEPPPGSLQAYAALLHSSLCWSQRRAAKLNTAPRTRRVALGLDAKLHEAGPVLEEYIQESSVSDAAAAEDAAPADGLVLAPHEYTAAVRMYAVEARPALAPSAFALQSARQVSSASGV
jgi:hypothetical protein